MTSPRYRPKLKICESKYAALLFTDCKEAIVAIVELVPTLEKMLTRQVTDKGAEVVLNCHGELDNMHNDVISWVENIGYEEVAASKKRRAGTGSCSSKGVVEP